MQDLVKFRHPAYAQIQGSRMRTGQVGTASEVAIHIRLPGSVLVNNRFDIWAGLISRRSKYQLQTASASDLHFESGLPAWAWVESQARISDVTISLRPSGILLVSG